MRNVLTALVVALALPAAAFAADSSATPAPAKVASRKHEVKAAAPSTGKSTPAPKTQEVKPAAAHEKQGRSAAAKKVRANKSAARVNTVSKTEKK
jgi:hypothetical protein